ncbi:hypothetical protein ACE38W_03255 [Chitinophaga sp. Hz27]|uniref:hypothetical protein n=1 Tax=Chitinophaga sp. Hz27 TaxID=3347169 RepID=UPI0035E25664
MKLMKVFRSFTATWSIVILATILTAIYFFAWMNYHLLLAACASFSFMLPAAYLLDTVPKKKYSLLTFLLLLSIGLKVTSYILLFQTDNHRYAILNHVMSAVIIGVLSIRLIFIIRKTRKNYFSLRHSTPHEDFFERIPMALKGIITVDKVREMLSAEIAVMYYLYSGKTSTSNHPFTYHKFGGVIAVYIVFIFLLIIEATGTTILLHKLSAPIPEKILFVLSIYSIIFLVAHIRAMKLRPIIINDDTLTIRYGLLTSVKIPLHSIKEIRTDKKTYPKGQPGKVKLALLSSLEQHNMLLELTTPIDLKLLFKRKKNIKEIYFRVDDQQAFINSINNMQVASIG